MGASPTDSHPTSTTLEHPPVTLGKTIYQVRTVTTRFTMDGADRTTVTTILTGPRGGEYFLRPFLGEDRGLRQVISYKSGQPLRVHGNEVRVLHLGDIIEVAR